jgi:hypothetical protein
VIYYLPYTYKSDEFYVAIYDFINIEPFFVPKEVGVVPLLTLSYMYPASGDLIPDRSL